MRKALGLFTVVLALGMVAMDAEAKRLGGARSSGMQRQQVAAPAKPPTNTPAQTPAGQPGAAPATAASAAPAAAAAAPAAAAGARRGMMGPIAAMAGVLGLAALASYFGFGEALANILMIVLLGVAVLVVIGLVMRKRQGGARPAMAGAGAGAGGFGGRPDHATYRQSSEGSTIGSRIGGGIGSRVTGVSTTPTGQIPADFDVEGFVRNAKTHFMALQAANDAGDLSRLREYLTPEMFEQVRADLHERGSAPQQTQVFGLDAQVLDVAQERGQWVVSVRFTGSVREQAGAVPEDLDEIWHLTKPAQGSGGWVVAGIQQA
ncbi:Tim44 domain-containing protein [Ramlibacter sp. AW1]|uniref:Tim44 domain-containing protein n=1 Tax=Ramlibacter aurantiacus TaxID=2801330 RepID=A0A937D8L2_9BURK|nr:TIM44-like domain-containing protein [Ramlibacter aurantiacus]MBL0422196.1 Tim44 domain-containing protein [Ramlibacter aurantiacus]